MSKSMTSTNLKKLIKLGKVLLYLLCFIILLILIINLYTIIKQHKKIYSLSKPHQISEFPNHATALVLGTAAFGNTPSPMLQRRLDLAISLYEQEKVKTLLLTGDNSGEYYNEVGAMESYALAKGVSAEDIILDHNGFSTYESIARASKVFNLSETIIISQGYHLPRSLMLAEHFGLDAIAYETDEAFSVDTLYNELREVPARVKDFFLGFTKMGDYSAAIAPQKGK